MAGSCGKETGGHGSRRRAWQQNGNGAMAERAPYRVAASAARDALERARDLGCSLEEHVALEAVVSLTALYSKLTDDVAVAVIAERARLHPKNMARALRRLRDLGVITYEPGRGRGNVSRVGLRVPETGAAEAPVFEGKKGSRSAPEKGVDPDPKREPLTRARRTEKVYREDLREAM
jgi:hypothetical protein